MVTDDFTVTAAGPATQLVVQLPSGIIYPGGPFSLDVFAEDGDGNIDPFYNGSVHDRPDL